MAFTTHDNAPYLYRKSGGGGDLEIDKLVGGTIAWNQQMIISTTGNREMLGLTITNNHDGSLTIVGTATGGAFNYWLWGKWGVTTELFKVEKDHNYFTKSVILFGNTDVLLDGDKKISDTFGNVSKARKSASVTGVRMANQTYGVTYNLKVYPMVCDLTLMFGSTIADYVYSLEQSSQGSGLAWLRSYGFFTEDYYDYNSGELKSVSNLVSHDMTGKNLLDTSTAEIGTAWNGNSNSARARLVIPLVVGQTYTLKANGTSTLDTWYGIETNTIPPTSSGVTPSNPYTFTATTKYLSLGFNKTEIASSDIEALKLQLELGSTATTHEPYTLHSYPLGDVTLRGLPKLNGNALYYDGDTYESNGTVTRKYGVVDLGTLAWSYSSTANHERMQTTGLASVIKSSTTTSQLANILCSAYKTITANGTYNHEEGVGIAVSTSRTVFVYDTAYTDAASFKTAMSGVYLVYELAEETTETADTYTNPQWVDPNGTEKYTLSTNAFPMPVGHETTYNTDIGSKTVNTQVNLSMTEPQVRQVYAKEGDTARVLNIHLDQTEEDGTLRILRPDGTEVTADAVLVPDFYDGLMAEIPSEATEIVGKCYCDVEQNGVSSMPFTLNVKKNERES